jgi:hypothetical protein
MFVCSEYSDHKILLELKNHDSKPVVWEPLIRKIGGVWNTNIGGWLFDKKYSAQIDEFVDTQNSIIGEKLNKEFYLKFGEEPDNYNTPSSTTSSSNHGMNEAFDLIHELFDRVSDLEKICEEHSRRLNTRRG